MAKLGQHFLRNHAAAKVAVESLRIVPEDTVIEIGPGHGELTRPLLASSCKKVIALERDPALAAALRGTDPRLEVVEGNALETLGELLARTRGPVKLAGNIPYYITGHLLRLLSEAPRRPERTVLLIQKEVAERIVARSPRMNRLAASVAFWADAKILMRLGTGDFRPAPKVESAVIELLGKDPVAPEVPYFRTVRTVFAQPRQTLARNLKRELGAGIIGPGLEKLGLDPGLRPQDLSVADLVGISELFGD